METHRKHVRLLFGLSLFTLMLAIIASLVVVPRVQAATNMTAADLAAACNATSSITFSTNTVVSGGTGTLQQTCYIHLAPGVILTMRELTLTSPSSSDIGFVVDGGDTTQISVSQSSFFMGGGLRLGIGAGEGGQLSGNQQITTISQSLLMAGLGPSNKGDLDVAASGCNNGGTVTVSSSTLQSPSAVGVVAGLSIPPDPLGCNGSNGKVEVTESSFASVSSVSSGVISIWTGQGGQTSVKQSTFSTNGPASLFAGVSCVSQDNTPNLPCNL